MRRQNMTNKQTKAEGCLVINDIHIPFEDKKTVGLWLRFAKWFKPDVVVINGDLLDCQTLGRFINDPFQEVSIVEEIRQGKQFFRKLRRAVGDKCRIVWIFGNHEFRFHSYIINNARELRGLEKLSLAEQMHVEDFNVEVVFSGLKESFMTYGDLYIGHYNKVSQHGGYTVKSLIDRHGVSVLQGHTHRFGTTLRTLLDDTVIGGFENGCMCELNPNYCMKPNWQHGFSIVWRTKKRGSKRFMVEQIPIIDHKFIYGGMEWQ